MKQNFVRSIILLGASALSFSAVAQVAINEVDQNYTPTVIPTYEQADTIFSGLETHWNNFFQTTNCYHRAYIWSHDMFLQNQVKSMKVWLFFTNQFKDRYKDKYDKPFKWWFHTAPVVLVGQNHEEYVMDRFFTKSPLTLHDWEVKFLYGVADPSECPVITNFKDGYPSIMDTPRTCYVLLAPMYYMQPMDVQNAHKARKPYTDFREGDIKFAEKYRGQAN